MRDLIPFVKFKKREKKPWRSVVFSKLKVSLLHGCFHVSKIVKSCEVSDVIMHAY